MKSKSAAGMEGKLLIYPSENDGRILVYFRVYDKDEHGRIKRNEDGKCQYKDYKIWHHDLEIKLLDGHCYETDGGNFIDYSYQITKDKYEKLDHSTTKE
jgi:hypothetical protein